MSNSKTKQTKHPIHVILANLSAMHITLPQNYSTHAFSLLFSLQYLQNYKNFEIRHSRNSMETMKETKVCLNLHTLAT